MTGDRPDTGDASRPAMVAAMAGGAVAFAALYAIAMSRNGGNFDYALDDVYIHLSMAEQIARGGYGINAGELASAASSPLYPILLTPFASGGGHFWWPLLWNVAALLTASALFGLVLARAGLGRAGLLLAAVAPFALTMYVTAFAGMENMAHGAASLAIVLGLWHFVETRRTSWLLVVGTFLATAFRLEGLALGLAAAATVGILGNLRAAIMLATLAIAPALVFSGALLAMGLDPLPNSVTAKLADTGGGGPLETFALNRASYGGRYLFLLAAALTLAGALVIPNNRARGYFALAVAAAGFAHLLFGATGWMDRYENYAVLSVAAALTLVLVEVARPLRVAAVAVVLLGGIFTYARYTLPVYGWNPTAISSQQGEMARFAKDFVQGPVAVNDIGYVAWQNPDYVLDLWGLASPEALALRENDPGQGWGAPLAARHDVGLVMIYDRLLGDAVAEDWQRLGTLSLDVPSAFLGGRDVAFYATDPARVPVLLEMLGDWQQDLPPRASFSIAGGLR